MRDQSSLPLNSCIGNQANLVTVELFPLLVVKFSVEGDNRIGLYEVNKCVAHVALILVLSVAEFPNHYYLKINGEVEKVVAAFVIIIDGSQQHFLCIFVGNILDHESCPCIVTRDNLLQKQGELANVIF